MGKLASATLWRHVVGLSALSGIGFTVSLFITNLAFADSNQTDTARRGIMAGSLLAGIRRVILLSTTPTVSEARRQSDIRQREAADPGRLRDTIRVETVSLSV